MDLHLTSRHCFKQPWKRQRYFHTILKRVLTKLPRNLKWTCLPDFRMVLTNVSKWGIMVLCLLDMADTLTFFLKNFCKIEEWELSWVDIGSCSLHIKHGTFGTNAEKSEQALKKLLKVAFVILHNTPGRREILQPILAVFACPTRYELCGLSLRYFKNVLLYAFS